MLLSDPATAQFIAREFVPCWETVRPVPQVTINFGNGKVLKRTLAGNTVLYICMPDGRVVDALPGVYTPPAFQAEANKALALLRTLQHPSADANFGSAIAAWHKTQIGEAISSERRRITFSKMAVESPLLQALGLFPRPAAPARAVAAPINQNTPVLPNMDLPSAFAAVCARTEDVSHLAATSGQVRRRLSAAGQPRDLSPEELGKMAVELDTTNNLRLVRPAVHMLLAQSNRLPLPGECRDTIYKRILHVPIDDPMLGLAEIAVPGSP